MISREQRQIRTKNYRRIAFDEEDSEMLSEIFESCRACVASRVKMGLKVFLLVFIMFPRRFQF